MATNNPDENYYDRTKPPVKIHGVGERPKGRTGAQVDTVATLRAIEAATNRTIGEVSDAVMMEIE